ncbi:MAG: GNAT family N-acetyltransferase [Actinobacteria bacterium]|nr:GNAT family N-acetyltransferase [Actinomycetota bacterium]
MSDEVRVRPAEPGDAAAFVQLARAVGEEPGGWLLGTSEWRSVGDERRYLKALRRHPGAAAFAAELPGGRVVGRLSLAREGHPASAHVADLGLMVDAGHRRRGVGTALLQAATAWAGGVGVTKLELHVFPWNEPALALYEGFGFVREGYRRRHYRRQGEEVDAILMALFVGESET